MKELILNVNGLSCVSCENRIQNSVKSIKGVKEVIADHTKATVTVIARKEIDETLILKKIQDIGFEVVGKE